MMKKQILLSVVLATRNEEQNIGRCLEAAGKIFSGMPGKSGEIIVFDEYSDDNTVEIAKKHGAKVYLEPHHDNFHITKQMAIDRASGSWILQLDADEVVTPELAREIRGVIGMSDEEIVVRVPQDRKKEKLFKRHTDNLIKRGDISSSKAWPVAAFFIPRRNMFLGKPLLHAGVYPDAVIRLIKKGKARLPAKDVHEQMEVDGQVSWLFSDLLHYDSPTLRRYFSRLNRYTDLHAENLKQRNTPKNVWSFLRFTVYHSLYTFINLYVRHRGYKDGLYGFFWSVASAWHFPIAYYKYITE